MDVFTIEIDPPRDGAYPLRATTAAGDQAAGAMTPPQGDAAFDALLAKLAQRDGQTVFSADEVLGMGRRLYALLFQGAAERLFQRARRQAARAKRPLQLQLRFASHPALAPVAALPWALLIDRQGKLVVARSPMLSTPPDQPNPDSPAPGPHSWIRGVAVSGDGSAVVSGGADGTVQAWDAHARRPRYARTDDSGCLLGCAISADGGVIVAASADGLVRVWEGATGHPRHVLRGHDGKARSCAASADGTVIASASEDGTVRVWEGATGHPRHVLRGHDGVVTDCAVSADGATIVSAAEDGLVRVWDGRSGQLRDRLAGHARRVLGCAISADGLTIASTSADQTVRVWDARTGRQRHALSGHAGLIWGCAISADGATIVSASWDKTVRVWDAAAGAERARWRAEGWLWGCAISADGGLVVAGGQAGMYWLRLGGADDAALAACLQVYAVA